MKPAEEPPTEANKKEEAETEPTIAEKIIDKGNLLNIQTCSALKDVFIVCIGLQTGIVMDLVKGGAHFAKLFLHFKKPRVTPYLRW